MVEVARQAGHAPTMTLGTYAHVMADLDGSDRVSAEAAIRAAREAEVSRASEKPAFGLEPKTSSLQVSAAA